MMTPYHVKVAAEAFAAGLFAQAGCDVSVQYGADQPQYDLIVSRGEVIKKVSVKGSQEGKWGLAQSYLKNANYRAAIDSWLSTQGEGIILCLVQFKGIKLGEGPRTYLATPKEIAERLKGECKGRGATILYEDHVWTDRAIGAGTHEKLPGSWRFSIERLEELMK
jgi:hypothetical protein